MLSVEDTSPVGECNNGVGWGGCNNTRGVWEMQLQRGECSNGGGGGGGLVRDVIRSGDAGWGNTHRVLKNGIQWTCTWISQILSDGMGAMHRGLHRGIQLLTARRLGHH